MLWNQYIYLDILNITEIKQEDDLHAQMPVFTLKWAISIFLNIEVPIYFYE